MLSLILYGRNDSHGYNLHKRAAISLNAMADMLTDAADEILFVDYNTPDDLPTFIEAIGDTLTDKARALLRVLRVRPAQHAPFRDKTHLVALEPVARNIALRRANPGNRWVLSTNTDMIFVPHRRGASLSDIVGAAGDGFYQLPRFELPESLWESYDRRDGAGIIGRTRDWAARYHLNEVVYGSDAVLFDGPGDFQLCLQSDLRRIHGFHEGMLRGWHVDANLCVRMIALRGEIKSMADQLAGYHCDHTRQATSLHRHDRVENDIEAFRDERSPYLPSQQHTWGLPDTRIEEVRLGRGDVFSRYVRALDAAIPAPQTQIYESAYRAETFGALTYRRAHVLPFVIDLLAAYPRGATIFYAGARADTGADIAAACAALENDFTLTAPTEFDWLNPIATLRRAPLEAALDSADILIFEFGIGEPGELATPELEKRLEAARRALVTAAERESARLARGAGDPRRVLTINAIHNSFEGLVAGLMAFTLTPFSSRVRHGYILADELPRRADVRAIWRDVQRTLGRRRPLPLWETHELAHLARSADLAGMLSTEALASADPLIALLRHEDTEQVCGLPVDRARALADRLELERPGLAPRRLLYSSYGAAPRNSALHSLSRVLDVGDWEKPSFSRVVEQHFGGGDALALAERNPWTWERASVLDILGEAGLLVPDARILVVSTASDALAPVLACYVNHVEVARARPGEGVFLGARTLGEADPRGFESQSMMWGPDQASDAPFSAVLFIQQSAMLRGPRRVPQALSEAARLVKPGGLVIMSAAVSLCGAPRANEFSARPLAHNALASLGALEFAGPLEVGLTGATCDRVVNHVRADLRYRRLIELHGQSISGEAVLTFRRTASASADVSAVALGAVLDTGAGSGMRFQFRRLARLAQRADRRVRWEIDRRRPEAGRRQR